MYQKRLNTYSSMGYTIFAPTGDIRCNIIFTIKDYQDMFWRDIRKADKSVYISSPRLSRQRVLDFKKLLTELRNPQTEFVVCTLPTAEYAENQRKGIEFMKNMLKNSGVDIKEYDNLNCHFAVIDNDLV